MKNLYYDTCTLTVHFSDLYFQFQILRAKYLNEVYLKPRFNESLNLPISSLVGCFKNINAFQVFSKCFIKPFTINYDI